MQLLDGKSQSGEKFKDIAEVYESPSNGSGGQCLIARTEQLPHYKELGPPDLVYIVKGAEKGGGGAGGVGGKSASSNNRNPNGNSPTSKEVASYHHVLGNDNSSSASIAAYINSLTYSMETSTGWFRSNPWSIIRAVYCSWDPFNEVDVRVEAKIPGGVTAYALSPNGHRVPATTEMWQSVLVGGLLRAIYYSDLHVPALRQMDPFPTEATEIRFLELSRKLFGDGPNLGSEKGQPHVDLLNNYLARGIMKYFIQTQRPSMAVDFYTSLIKTFPSVHCLLAESQLAADMENIAVQTMHRMITKIDKRSASMLALEASFILFHPQQNNELISEGIELAKESIKCSPLDTTNWLILIEGLIKEKEYGEALLALNNTPMVGQAPFEIELIRFLNAFPPGSKLWHPTTKHQIDSTADRSNSKQSPNNNKMLLLEHQGENDGVLERLKSPHLKGLLAQAYELVIKIFNQIGWDELLHLRSQLFLMEEDCCKYKNKIEEEDFEEEQREENFRTEEKVFIHAGGEYPKIESTDEMEDVPLNVNNNNCHTPTTPKVSSPINNESSSNSPSSSSKRLCERWLDNLFMILFEDLRVLTLFRSELAHNNSANIPYTRTIKEWLILGDLAERMGAQNEARDCWRRVVEGTLSKNDSSMFFFIRKAWMKLLKVYVDEGRVSHALTAASRITSINLSLYHEKTITQSTELGSLILRLIRNEGMERVKVCLAALNLAAPIDSLLQTILTYCSTRRTIGCDY